MLWVRVARAACVVTALEHVRAEEDVFIVIATYCHSVKDLEPTHWQALLDLHFSIGTDCIPRGRAYINCQAW